MATAIPKNHVELTARAAAASTGGVVLRSRNVRARGIVSDTREITGGEAFIALRGASHDAHAFLDQAAERGAELLVIDGEHSLPEGPDVVRVPSTLTAWGDLARAHARAWRCERADRRVVAITGSAGKTTTKQLCAAILAEVAATHATPGNLNNLVGVPAVLFALEPEHRFAVIECGMSVRGEIATLASLIEPDVAVITNVSVAHAEGVGGSRDDVAREKGALFDALGEDATCIFDADDPVGRALAARCTATRKIGFGRTVAALYRLMDRVPLGLAGSRVTIERPRSADGVGGVDTFEVDLPFVGEAAAVDLCAALAAADAAAGVVTRDAIASALKRVHNVDGRAAIHQTAFGAVIIDDSYNANPASMRAAFSILGDIGQRERRRVAILGEMKELGAIAEAEHLALGDALAAAGVGLVIGCGGLATHIASRAGSLGIAAVDCASVDAAIVSALERIGPTDVVLIKGSRSTGTERIVAALKARGPR
jgi:UDP-N-acetylmuramoyl-tripeptide--D-alanyl-D-alanine ligase